MLKTGVAIKDSIEKSTLIYLSPSHNYPVCIQRIVFIKYVEKGHIFAHATETRNVSERASQSSGIEIKG